MKLPLLKIIHTYHSFHLAALAIVTFSFLITICEASPLFASIQSMTFISTHNQTFIPAISPSKEPGTPMVTLGQGTSIGQQDLSKVSRSLGENTFVLYENPRYGFSIQYPSGWLVRDREASGSNVVVEFFSPMETERDTFVDNFNVGVQNLSGTISLDEYGQSVVNLLNSRPPGPDFELTQQPTSTALGGFPAQKIEYTMVLQNESAPGVRTTLHGMQVWTINDDSIFVLSFVAEQNKFALYQPTIEHIIRTFKMAGS